MMIEKVITGGQTGADQAGWRAAKRAGIVCGGWMPKGFLTEDGPRPEFAEMYGAREHESSEYPPRTKANVADSQLTLWFGSGDSLGYWCTKNAANKQFKPFWDRWMENPGESPQRTATNLIVLNFTVINVAGPRASKYPHIGETVEQFLLEVFKITNDLK